MAQQKREAPMVQQALERPKFSSSENSTQRRKAQKSESRRDGPQVTPALADPRGNVKQQLTRGPTSSPTTTSTFSTLFSSPPSSSAAVWDGIELRRQVQGTQGSGSELSAPLPSSVLQPSAKAAVRRTSRLKLVTPGGRTHKMGKTQMRRWKSKHASQTQEEFMAEQATLIGAASSPAISASSTSFFRTHPPEADDRGG